MARYLITGGAGFIGSHLAEALVQRQEEVCVFDNFATGKADNLAHLVDHIELIEGDIRDLAALGTAMPGVDYVLHQAALPSVPRSIADPLTSHAVNATGTLNLLLVAREAGVKRVVYASSSSVYGQSELLPKREDMPLIPVSPYATSKLAGENYCRAFMHVYGLETVCLRYFNVFGPRQDPASPYAAVIPKFIRLMSQGLAPTVYGDGHQTRDFTYVANVVQANLLACHADGIGGQVFNAACGERHELLEVIAALNRLLGTTLEPILAEPRPGDLPHSLADITQAREILGYVPEVRLEAGLEYTVRAYQLNNLG